VANEVAQTILEQLGGNKFLTMTGARVLSMKDNTLQVIFPLHNGVNRLDVVYDLDDTYTMLFIKYIAAHMKGMEWISEKVTVIREFGEVFFDSLQDIFTQVTGLDTRL